LAAEAILELHNAGAAYGRVEVLRDVSFQLGRSECLAVLGANGAGKTTLLRAIAGLMVRRSGRVTFAGTPIESHPAHAIVRLGCSLVAEGRHLFAPLSVDENLDAGALPLRASSRAAGIPAQRDLVYELFPRLAERRTQRAGTLSGGEQQMLAIGRALMAAPALLLLDEPSVGLAPLVVCEMFGALQRLKVRGLSIVIAEQHVPLALELADRAIVLHVGQVELAGPSRDLIATDAIRRIYLGGDTASIALTGPH
jgi:branched-chain amino acid transport system ATP-binding protein